MQVENVGKIPAGA